MIDVSFDTRWGMIDYNTFNTRELEDYFNSFNTREIEDYLFLPLYMFFVFNIERQEINIIKSVIGRFEDK